MTETTVHNMYTCILSHSLEGYIFFVSPTQNSWPHLCSFYSSVNKYNLTYSLASSIDTDKVGVAFPVSKKVVLQIQFLVQCDDSLLRHEIVSKGITISLRFGMKS